MQSSENSGDIKIRNPQKIITLLKIICIMYCLSNDIGLWNSKWEPLQIERQAASSSPKQTWRKTVGETLALEPSARPGKESYRSMRSKRDGAIPKYLRDQESEHEEESRQEKTDPGGYKTWNNQQV